MTQQSTGVQRYAREILAAMDDLLVRSRGRGTVFVPRRTDSSQPYRALEVEEVRPGRGHAWEQLVLPLRCRTPLLNLCNTAPSLGNAQVVCIHDANVFEEPQSYSLTFRTFYKTLQPWIAKRALRVTTVSNNAAHQLARHLGLAARDITVLPNGHEHVLTWQPSRSSILQRLPSSRAFVLVLGSQARHKNVNLILKLADALDTLGLDIVIAGGSASIYAATASDKRSNVHWLGRVLDDDLAALFSAALCLAFPSFTEGFGLPVLEAMALGCPVVSSDRASLPEVCGAAALLAEPTDPPTWLRHFAALSATPSLRADLRDAGREQAKLFSWRSSAQGYLELFGHAGLWRQP